jgi:hypothetical protein
MYEVSNMGNVRRGNKGLSLDTKVKGYVVVTLSGAGKQRQYKVHLLVAVAFLPPPPNDGRLWTVDHVNRKEKTNNKVSNLRWATKSQQSLNRDNSNATSFKKPVDQLSLGGELVQTWASAAEAARSLSIQQSNIGAFVAVERPKQLEDFNGDLLQKLISTEKNGNRPKLGNSYFELRLVGEFVLNWAHTNQNQTTMATLPS